jgi:hypothetical protein
MNETFLAFVTLFNSLLRQNKIEEAESMLNAKSANGAEEWYIQYLIMHLNLAKGIKEQVIFHGLRCYEMKPNRLEALYHVIKLCREQSWCELGYNFATIARQIKLPESSEFMVEREIYDYLLDYEISICAFYAGQLDDGLKTSSHLLLKHTPLRHSILSNLKFYIRPLTDIVHHELSSERKPHGWNACNPGICENKGEIVINVRLVNSGGDWLHLNAAFGSPPVSAEHPVRTMNIRTTWPEQKWQEWDCKHELPKFGGWVLGLEDLRIFSFHDKVWFLATAREFSPTLQCEMILGNNSHAVRLISPVSETRNEKNWLPFIYEDRMLIVYDYNPFTILEITNPESGKYTIVSQHHYDLDLSSFRGSAPPALFQESYYWIIHEVGGESNDRRVYTHRIIKMNKSDFRITHISLPFTMQGTNNIEYVSGLMILGDEAYISWGDNDQRAMLSITKISTLDHLCNPI